MKKIEKFDKYEKKGAYHWREYYVGCGGYKEKVHKLLGHFKEPGASLLDVGCGDGLITHKLWKTKRFDKILGIDNSLKAIELARLKCKKAIETGELNFSHKAFTGLNRNVHYDYIVCHEVIEHVPNPEILLSVINRLVNKYAIITTPNSKYNKSDRYDYNVWSKREFEKLFQTYSYEFLSKGKFLYVKLSKKE